MGMMAELSILIEDLENCVGDYRSGNDSDLFAIIFALWILDPIDKILEMPEVKRCPIADCLIREYQ